MLRKLDDHTFVSGQVAVGEVAGFAAQGITVLVNNRPDGENPDQPAAVDIEAAARAAGISYRFVPVQRGIGPAEVEGMREAMQAAGDGSLLAYCRSGTRSALTWALAKRAEGASAADVTKCVLDAGFDPSPIAHLL
jgi:uncharacterized protein (TIGR01244 family)